LDNVTAKLASVLLIVRSLAAEAVTIATRPHHVSVSTINVYNTMLWTL